MLLKISITQSDRDHAIAFSSHHCVLALATQRIFSRAYYDKHSLVIHGLRSSIRRVAADDFEIEVPDSLFRVTIREEDIQGRPCSILDCAITRAIRRIVPEAWTSAYSLHIDDRPYTLTPQAHAFRLAFDRGKPVKMGALQLL